VSLTNAITGIPSIDALKRVLMFRVPFSFQFWFGSFAMQSS